MKIADYTLLNIGPTPIEVKRQRKYCLEFQLKYGRPIIFKHRWNLNDVQQGLATICPYQDLSYHRNKTDCPYCFGTGFLGGFADGVITFVTLADTEVDQLQISEQGYILYERHPQLVAPWYPTMGDGDLIITAEFDRATWQVLKTLEVYELNDCKPITVRGPFTKYTDYQLFNLQFNSQIDRIPNNHVYYNVPVEFNYLNVPTIIPPIGEFPSDYPPGFNFTNVPFRINGGEGGLLTTNSQPFKMVGNGTLTTESFGFKMIGGKNPLDVGVIFNQ